MGTKASKHAAAIAAAEKAQAKADAAQAKALAKKQAGKARRAAERDKAKDRPPQIRVPVAFGIFRSIPFTAENVVSKRVWAALVADAGAADIPEDRLRQLFHAYCKPDDDSYGTILVDRLLKDLEDRWRHVLNILYKRRAAGKSRLKFEEFVDTALDFCTRDLFALVRGVIELLRNRVQATDAWDVCLLYAQLHSRWPQRRMLKEVLARLHDRSEVHSWDALVHLMLRYPVAAIPFLSIQQSVERRFFGMPHWQLFHRTRGHELFPAPFDVQVRI